MKKFRPCFVLIGLVITLTSCRETSTFEFKGIRLGMPADSARTLYPSTEFVRVRMPSISSVVMFSDLEIVGWKHTSIVGMEDGPNNKVVQVNANRNEVDKTEWDSFRSELELVNGPPDYSINYESYEALSWGEAESIPEKDLAQALVNTERYCKGECMVVSYIGNRIEVTLMDANSVLP